MGGATSTTLGRAPPPPEDGIGVGVGNREEVELILVTKGDGVRVCPNNHAPTGGLLGPGVGSIF